MSKPGTYWAFSLDHDQADAVRRYRERFGEAPEQIIKENTMYKLGPLPDTDVLGRKRETTNSNPTPRAMSRSVTPPTPNAN